MALCIHQITACSHCYCSWITNQACRRASVQQQLHCSCLTELQSYRCKAAALLTARVPFADIQDICITLQLYIKRAHWSIAASVIRIPFMIRMCLLSWELGADEIILLQTSHNCVSLVQHGWSPSLSDSQKRKEKKMHWNPMLHIKTQNKQQICEYLHPLFPQQTHFAQIFPCFSPFLLI